MRTVHALVKAIALSAVYRATEFQWHMHFPGFVHAHVIYAEGSALQCIYSCSYVSGVS